MAVGEDYFPKMYPVPGFKLGVASAGIKSADKKDLVVMEMVEGSSIAGFFTKNSFCAAPVQLSKEYIYSTKSRYLVTNTGNANAGTGEIGRQNAEAVCQALGNIAGVKKEAVLPFSTGVIGEHLPVQKIISALPSAYTALTETGWDDAALSILTTDTRPKGVSTQLKLAGKEVTVTGISKGSGMIRPDMATMLAYVATDAVIEEEHLKRMLGTVVDCSFNRITIDGDMSTNDCAILVATGASGVNVSQLTESDADKFLSCLKDTFLSLAQQIIKDG
jgi:glutamate N-acetyltransferase/amino-acid N-acetyltransferase